MRRTRLIAVLALCLSLAACAERINPAELKAEGTHPAWLAGNSETTGRPINVASPTAGSNGTTCGKTIGPSSLRT